MTVVRFPLSPAAALAPRLVPELWQMISPASHEAPQTQLLEAYHRVVEQYPDLLSCRECGACVGVRAVQPACDERPRTNCGRWYDVCQIRLFIHVELTKDKDDMVWVSMLVRSLRSSTRLARYVYNTSNADEEEQMLQTFACVICT